MRYPHNAAAALLAKIHVEIHVTTLTKDKLVMIILTNDPSNFIVGDNPKMNVTYWVEEQCTARAWLSFTQYVRVKHKNCRQSLYFSN